MPTLHAFPRSLPKSLPLLVFPMVASMAMMGCGWEGASIPNATVRDSAGITITENPGVEFPGGGGWSVAPEPEVVIGSFDGPEEEQLYRVRGAARLSDGRIALGNEGSQEIRFFNSDGSFSYSIGGEGEGPGEFSSVLLAGFWGDTLVVIDRRQKRVSLLHPEEGFVRSFNVTDGVVTYPLTGWVFGTGSVLFQDLPMDEAGGFADGFSRSPVPYGSCDMEGEALTDFGRLPGSEMLTVNRQTEHGLATMVSSVPFGKDPQTTVAGDYFYFGSHDAYQIDVFRSDGQLERIIRVAHEPVPVTEADFSAYVEEAVGSMSDEEQARARRRDLEAMPRVETRPPHGALYADTEGYLFVEDYVMPGDQRKGVTVFDPEGRMAGGFELPADLQVLDVGSDYLLARYEDDLEVEYVCMYRLTRPG